MVLGSVRVVGTGGELPLHGRLRTVLAVLLCRAGEAASTDELIEAVWGDKPPRTARKNLQVYVHQLRRALGPEASVLLRDRGYALIAGDDEVDSRRFDSLVAEGRRALGDGASERGRALLRDALALWRGPAYAGITEAPIVREEAARLHERRLAAVEARVEADLAAGDHAAVVPELTALVAEHPWREGLIGQLTLALYRGGRQAEALRVLRDARRALADELGIEPGPGLRRLEQAILANGPGLDLSASASAGPSPNGPPRPAQLPADVVAFTGRTMQLHRLDALLASGAPLLTIVGTAGVGKTALALHWAHRVRGRFGDGQLYVNLRGYDQRGQAVRPAEAMRGFLDALGAAPEQVPAGIDAQAALYRSLMVDRRMLVVLDNARDAGQVRPLLPGAGSSLVVVTSRSRLTGLVANEGAQPFALDPFPPLDARELLARRLGPHRVSAEPEAVDAVVARCAGLPLALVIAAARAATQPDRPFAVFADELLDAPGLLDALSSDDITADVRAVFSWSYTALSAPAARLFRLLGLVAGADVGWDGVASLLGAPAAQAGPPLAELLGAHLLYEPRPDRFTSHDLLRSYAAELVQALEPSADRQAAGDRLLDHYLHTARGAALLLAPGRHPPVLDPPAPGVTVTEPRDAATALRWFTSEEAALLAASRTAPDAAVPPLGWALSAYLHPRGALGEWATIERAVLDACGRLADPRGQAHAHRNLSRAFTLLGRFDDAVTHAGEALRLATDLGDAVGQAYGHHELTWALARRGRYEQGLTHARSALELFRTVGHRAGTAKGLNGVGYCLTLLGRHTEALSHCHQARALFEGLGDRKGEAAAWDGIGYAQHHLGRFDLAVECHTRALRRYVAVSDRVGETEALIRLGNAHHGRGAYDEAREAWSRALTFLDGQRHPDAVHLRTQLAAQPPLPTLHWPHR